MKTNLLAQVDGSADIIRQYISMLTTENNYQRRAEVFECLPTLIECLSKLVDIAERIKICGLDKEGGDAT